MKKTIAVLLGATIVLGPVMLAACGEDGDENGSERSEKITTATAWAEAFDFSDTDKVTVYLDGYEGGRTYYWYFDGNKFKSVTEYPDGKIITKYTEYKKDEDMPGGEAGRGTEYSYTFDEQTEKWSVKKGMIYDMETVQGTVNEIDKLTTVYDETAGKSSGSLSERFSDFEYDEKTYSYVASWDTLDYYRNVFVSLKFKNKKAYSGEGTFTYDDESGPTTASIKFKIYDIGTTKVTLPELS